MSEPTMNEIGLFDNLSDNPFMIMSDDEFTTYINKSAKMCEILNVPLDLSLLKDTIQKDNII